MRNPFFHEKDDLSVLCDEKSRLLEAKDEDIKNLKARLSLANAETTEAINLRLCVSALEFSESSLIEQASVLQRERDSLEAKVAELQSLVAPPDNVLIYENDSLARRVFSLYFFFVFYSSLVLYTHFLPLFFL